MKNVACISRHFKGRFAHATHPVICLAAIACGLSVNTSETTRSYLSLTVQYQYIADFGQPPWEELTHLGDPQETFLVAAPLSHHTDLSDSRDFPSPVLRTRTYLIVLEVSILLETGREWAVLLLFAAFVTRVTICASI